MGDFVELKKFFFFSLIACLVVSAILAIISVLLGEFTDLSWNVLYTIFAVILHSLIGMFFIEDNEKRDTFKRLGLFFSTSFLLIGLSFITSIVAIWGVVSGEIISKIYLTFAVLFFMTLYANLLSRIVGKKGYIDLVVYLNYLVIAILVFMSQFIIYSKDLLSLGELFFRVFGSVIIVSGTLSVLALVFYQIGLNKNFK